VPPLIVALTADDPEALGGLAMARRLSNRSPSTPHSHGLAAGVYVAPDVGPVGGFIRFPMVVPSDSQHPLRRRFGVSFPRPFQSGSSVRELSETLPSTGMSFSALIYEPTRGDPPRPMSPFRLPATGRGVRVVILD
jgi:hypothetical protein